MLTPEDIALTTAKFDQILSKRPQPHNRSDNFRAFQNISVIRKLGQGKFPIYLTTSKINNQNYAMKVFYHLEENSYAHYQNEMRFASLKHPNIITMLHCENEHETFHRGEFKIASYILMEYAPYGDFFDLIVKHHNQIDEKLVRTYFRQLVSGIEFLHGNGVAHLDLKPENLLIGSDFNLKIADFDMSHVYGDSKVLSRGTRYYRAPEFFKAEACSSASLVIDQPFAADIYSAGVVLFIMKNGGMYPHTEDSMLEGVSFVELMYKNNLKFWAKHCEIQGLGNSFYDREFKELFNHMTRLNSKERLTIRQIKGSKWYNGPVYTPEELRDKMKKILGVN